MILCQGFFNKNLRQSKFILGADKDQNATVGIRQPARTQETLVVSDEEETPRPSMDLQVFGISSESMLGLALPDLAVPRETF